MSPSPLFIDNLAFSKKNERLEGNLTDSDCQRLSDLLQADLKATSSTRGSTIAIQYVLQGRSDKIGQHYLQLTINANLIGTCQRCLSELPINLALSFNYLIAELGANEADVNEIDSNDDIDLQEASQTMDVVALVEDEIIMAMPIAPLHRDGCSAATMQSGEKPNPFAVLKGLIKP